MTAPAPPFSFGSQTWPGAAKVLEESGELQQVIGKLLATGGDPKHWDGTDLRERLVEESADLMAALLFFLNYNGLDGPEWEARLYAKRKRFRAWHEDAAKPAWANSDEHDTSWADERAGDR